MTVLEQLKNYARTDRMALVNRDKQLSYRELDVRSDAFAAWLLDTFEEDRSPVVICGDKETDFLPCIFGALKSGRAYVPIDSVVPEERAAQIIADVKPKVMVDFTGNKWRNDAQLLTPSDLSEILKRPGTVSPESWGREADTAYILFTSGSTGRPKGVPVTAGNLMAFLPGAAALLSPGGRRYSPPGFLFLRCFRLCGLCRDQPGDDPFYHRPRYGRKFAGMLCRPGKVRADIVGLHPLLCRVVCPVGTLLPGASALPGAVPFLRGGADPYPLRKRTVDFS